MNTNLIHNILNLIGLAVGALVAVDWTTFGLNPGAAAQVAGTILLAQSVIKLAMNITRDGISGLAAPQPPVQK